MRSPVVSCPDCSNPVSLGATGWGRCRLCGHETLRESDFAAPFVPSYLADASPVSSVELYSRDEAEYVCAAVGGAGLVSLFDK